MPFDPQISPVTKIILLNIEQYVSQMINVEWHTKKGGCWKSTISIFAILYIYAYLLWALFHGIYQFLVKTAFIIFTNFTDV